MKNFFVILSVIASFFTEPAQAQTFSVHWYLPTLSVNQAQNLNGYNLFIGDPEVFFSSPAAIEQLKRDNPNIGFACYFNIAEWFNPMFPDKPWSIKVLKFLNQVPQWWLKGNDGQRISFWSSMQTMNCGITCPPALIDGKNQNYIEFISKIFIDNILKKYNFKYVLIDCAWDKIFWLGHYGKNSTGIDINGDGLVDDSSYVDNSWRLGMQEFIGLIAEFSGSKSIIGNPGHASFEISTMCEEFPCIYFNENDKIYEAWYENINMAVSRPGLKIFNSRKNNYWFTLCSSVLVDNTSFSYVQNSPFEKRWELNLGQPLQAAITTGEELTRKFTNGTVFVNPRLKTARIVYMDGAVRNN